MTITLANIAEAGTALASLRSAVSAWSVTDAPAPPTQPESTLWTSQQPAVDGGADSPVTIGTRFRVSVAGQILGVRFWKYAGNTGAHIATLWSNTGAKLAIATFQGETASGWQEVRFASPINVVPGVDYVVSYQALKGHYAFTTAYFTSPYAKGPMSASAGVFAYGAQPAYPSSLWQNGCYWVDAIFKANP